jgi:hypothetical protein
MTLLAGPGEASGLCRATTDSVVLRRRAVPTRVTPVSYRTAARIVPWGVGWAAGLWSSERRARRTPPTIDSVSVGLRVAMLAPIAWRVPPRQLVEEAITGFLVCDVKQAAEALTKVGSLDRAQVRQHAVAHFGLDRMTDEYLAA